MIVHLEPWELALAAKVGVARNAFALARGLANRDRGFEGREWDGHIEGAAGEVAFAKATDRYWDAYVGPTNPHRPDVGRFEVKTRSKPGGELWVPPTADDDVPFVLVRGRAPTFDVLGWVYAADAKVAGTLAAGEGRPVYWVPDAALRPIEALVR